MEGKTLARIGAAAFAGIAIAAAAIEITREEKPAVPITVEVSTAPADPMREALARCRFMGEAATNDPECLRTWVENRRRFLRAGTRPTASLPETSITQDVIGNAPPQPPGVDQAEQRRLAELERHRQELDAARAAKLFAATETRGADGGTVTSSGAETQPARPDLTSLGFAPQPATPSAQARQQAFLDAAPDKRTVSPDRIAKPASPNILQAGAVIPAALITGIRSDLPGQITAQVTQNVYDSPTGRILLVPQGARLIGQYDNGVGFGQRRVLLVWNRLILPNGRSIVLERQPGGDMEGYAGLEDSVDHHWWDLAKAAALSTLLSVGAQAGSSGEQGDLIGALRQGASDGISQTGRQIVGRQLDIAPTLTIRPGFPVRVIVTRDLVLEPYGATP